MQEVMELENTVGRMSEKSQKCNQAKSVMGNSLRKSGDCTDVVKKTLLVAVSGVKNSGKTTFLEHLIPVLTSRGYRVALIKHDGHEFEPDVPGTDTWKMRCCGAYGTAIFSKGQWMVNKQQTDMDEQKLAALFPEADIVLLEGFKYSSYPKFEIVRSSNSKESVCAPETLLGIITDLNRTVEGIPILGLQDWNRAADIIECLFFDGQKNDL